MSLRGIAKKTGHHIQRVQKYVEQEEWKAEHKQRKARESKIARLQEEIDGWVKEDLKRRGKYRRTASKIYNDLKNSKEY